MELTYHVLRSARRTFSLELRLDGLLVRAPKQATDRQIQAFVREHQTWAEEKLAKLSRQKAAAEALPKLSEADLRALTEKARQIIPQRVQYFAPLVGVRHGRVTIRNQRTRWGSCSAKGNLNFNCLLLLAPPQVLDSVVVHELCHLKHPNHSPAFYQEVLRVYPDYPGCDKWLKEHGRTLLLRMEP